MWEKTPRFYPARGGNNSDFLARFDRVPKPLIPPTTFVLRIADPEPTHHGPRPILGLYHHEDDYEHA